MRRLGHLALLPLVAACSSAAASSSPAEPPSALSSRGTYRLEAATLDGQPPPRGIDTLELEVTRAADARPAEHLTLSVKPWMPAMGHGAPPVEAIVEQGGGRYRLDGVSLYMPGLWELRTAIEPGDEQAVLSFEVQ